MTEMKMVPVEPTREMIEAMDQAVFTHGNVVDAYRAMLAASPQAPAREGVVSPLDDLVDRFTTALREKLHAAEAKYGHNDGWMRDDWRGDLVRDLNQHVEKGDPRDVAAYCAFAWHHGWPTALTAREEAPAEGAGWIVSNANADRWRAWDNTGPIGVDDRNTAIRYARREDAETAHAEDEDAWRVEPFSLRARTSEPEAGAVAGWERAWSRNGEVKTKDHAPKGWNLFAVTQHRLLPTDQPLYRHPAPATADKLRMAVEALEKAASVFDIYEDANEAAAARQALAALNEQPQ